MFASMMALLLLVLCAARAQSDPAGALCTADPEVDGVMHPAVSASINLLQVGLSMQERVSELEGEIAKYEKFGAKTTTEIKGEFLGSLSEDERYLDRKLPQEVSLLTASDLDRKASQEVSLLTAASLLTEADSILTAVSKEKQTFSAPGRHEMLTEADSILTAVAKEKHTFSAPVRHENSAPEMQPADGASSEGGGMLYCVVGCCLLLALCLPWCGCFKLKLKPINFVPKTLLRRAGTSDEATMGATPTEVYERRSERKASERNNKHNLMGLFQEIDKSEQSDESPLGYFTRADLAKALADPRVKREMVRLGLTRNDCDAVFELLDVEGDRLVDMGEFIDRVSPWAQVPGSQESSEKTLYNAFTNSGTRLSTRSRTESE